MLITIEIKYSLKENSYVVNRMRITHKNILQDILDRKTAGKLLCYISAN